MSKIYSRSSIFKDFIVMISILLVMDFWSYLPFLYGELGDLDFILHSLLLIIYASVIIANYYVLKRQFETIDKIVLWTIITIFIGILPSYMEYDQPVSDSIRACLRLTHGLFLYFVLRCWKYDPQKLMKIITIISVIWVILEIGQQFTYPDFWFSGRYFIWGTLNVRMDLYRFYIWGVDFVMIAFSYWFYIFMKNFSDIKKNYFFFLISIILMAGLFCYCSRKHIYAVIFLIIYYIFRLKGKKKIASLFFGGVLLVVLYLYFFEDFMEMDAEASSAQGTGEDFIRWIEAKYFLFDFSNSPLYPIWGVGLEAGGRLSKILNDLSDLHFYQADVGIIGYYSKFGLLGVSSIIWYIIYFIKNNATITLWLHGFFIMKLMLIVFDFWAIWDVGMTAYAVFLYFLYCNLKSNRTKMKLR